MSFITRLFRKQKEEDYDTILSTLANDIRKRQVQLSEIRLRERRATLLVTLYTLAAWVAYVSLWYTNLLPNIRGRGSPNSMEKALGALPVLLGPIAILFIRRIVQIWYSRKGDAEERTLQKLLKQQREKVEEIKKKTNYYSTRELLQRYDDSPSGTPPQQKSLPTQPPVTPQQQLKTPQRTNGAGAGAPRTPVSPALMQQLSTMSSTPPEPPRKQWLDKIVDVVLGDDDSARFALICEKCFAHNGLVKESVWEDTQYLCPKCKHFNPSKRSKKLGISPSPIAASASSSPSSSLLSPQSQSPSSAASRSPVSMKRRSQSSQPKSPLSNGPDETEDQIMMDVVEDEE
ncbi:hypothetical protein BT96DRAFT_997814 [Gymnopus androsaceus JB14]|uniref:Endoplasmic reticulum junction formation protein lunapark n=1 Tax=Gymnopus androsaceus JB14 TaxID=1447944 RepID=A0A6A4HA94_9AGAR|nr:hypothetical protein BT96DRAFT_997814 [Gymnopus androsaceus JB14]